jgi:diguanylate cyclase (GGDEF)-like protein
VPSLEARAARKSGDRCGGAKFDLTTKQQVSAALILFSTLAVAWAAPPAPLTTLRAVAALTNDQVTQKPAVTFEATVIYYFAHGSDLNVQDGNVAIYVKPARELNLQPGDRVLVQGALSPSFLPFVDNAEVTVLGHGALPKPIPATFDDLVHTRLNCRYVTVRGEVRAADVVKHSTAPNGRLQLLTNGGYIDVHVDTDDSAALSKLLDAEVEVTGSAGRLFDGKMQQAGVKIKASSLDDIKVLKRADASPWSLPVTQLGNVIGAFHVIDRSQRVRVHGTITYYLPGAAAVLQDGTHSLWISTQSAEPLQIGDSADAIGFPDTSDLRLSLAHAEIQDEHIAAPIVPERASWAQLASWTKNTPTGHQYDLVSIEGQLVSEVREAAQDEYVLNSGGRLLTAVYRHPQSPMLEVPLGSTIRVTGICMVLGSSPVNGEAPFDILLRSFADVEVISQPPWLTVYHVAELSGLLLLVALLLGARGWFLERNTRREIVSLAYVEQRRSKILEDINHSKPLAEILERITELVSVRLNGAPCWCQIADGATLGNRPQRLDAASLRTAEQLIESRSGAPLGCIFAAFNAQAKSRHAEKEALAMGAGLATLAIETYRLYSDLVHRSEFDLLTDLQNRFALEKALDAMIAAARQSAGIFGLIYIDLNEFKQVNDNHGHLVGDLYLQEAAQRMKRQLRPCDTMARFGGDEFTALIPEVRNRTEIEEIAARLEACFVEPFHGDGYTLHGSASIGFALYPEDANTADGLLKAADAAMYVEKYTRPGRSSRSAPEHGHEFTPKGRG